MNSCNIKYKIGSVVTIKHDKKEIDLVIKFICVINNEIVFVGIDSDNNLIEFHPIQIEDVICIG